jgi:hypothetical protein
MLYNDTTWSIRHNCDPEALHQPQQLQQSHVVVHHVRVGHGQRGEQTHELRYCHQY